MKFAIMFFTSALTATSAFASSSYCLDAKLSWNSLAKIACPAATKICVQELDTNKKTAKSIVLVDGRTQTLELAFTGYEKQNYYDVSSHLIYNFSAGNQYAAYEVESDYSYPYPTESGTFTALNLSTGVKSMDQSGYPSQHCSYEIIKK